VCTIASGLSSPTSFSTMALSAIVSMTTVEVRVVCQMLAPPRRQIVDRNHLIAALQEHFHHMRTDLAKAAGYQNPSSCRSF
jgi:hypothetical protein